MNKNYPYTYIDVDVVVQRRNVEAAVVYLRQREKTVERKEKKRRLLYLAEKSKPYLVEPLGLNLISFLLLFLFLMRIML